MICCKKSNMINTTKYENDPGVVAYTLQSLVDGIKICSADKFKRLFSSFPGVEITNFDEDGNYTTLGDAIFYGINAITTEQVHAANKRSEYSKTTNTGADLLIHRARPKDNLIHRVFQNQHIIWYFTIDGIDGTFATIEEVVNAIEEVRKQGQVFGVMFIMDVISEDEFKNKYKFVI